MNFFNITNYFQYVSAYKNQNSFKQKSRRDKSNSNRVFGTKIIIDSSFKILFKITFKSKFDFKKSTIKNLKQKEHAYIIVDDEKKVDYYDSSNEEKNDDFNANHENKNSTSNLSKHDSIFAEIIMITNFKSFQCKKCRILFIFNNKLFHHIRSECNSQNRKKMKIHHVRTRKSI